MRQLFSTKTWWYKKAFPRLWFGGIGLFTLAWIPGVLSQEVPAPTLLMPPSMALIGYVLMRFLIFPLVDEVYLDGDEIVVRNQGQEDRFPISNIMKVEGSLFINPERVTLTLKQPSQFGSEIEFLPPDRLWRLSRHPLVGELIQMQSNQERK